MKKDFLTLQEAAVLIGKSVQTVRRLIKKGDLKAQRIKTPQGFHYVIQRENLGIQMLPDSTIQNDDTELVEEERNVLTNQNENLTSQSKIEVQKKATNSTIDKNTSKVVDSEHESFDVSPKKNEVPAYNEEMPEYDEKEKNELMQPAKAKNEAAHNNAINKQKEKIIEKHIERIIEKVIECDTCERTKEQLKTTMDRQYAEKMGLIRIIEKLQKDLDFERRKPRSLTGYLMDWFLK